MAYPYYGPQRTPSNEIILYLSPKQPAPEAPPIELQNYIAKDVWNYRIPAITRVASRYSKPVLERIWMTLAFLTIVITPFVVYPILVNSIHNDSDNAFTDNGFRNENSNTVDHLFEARAISFGIFFGSLLFFYVSIGVWKYMGRKRVNALLRGWAREDSATRGTGASIPFWKVRTPGVFSNNITLTITVPFEVLPTSFHPDAYLPSYINGPMDADAKVYLPYGGQSGFSQLSDLPLYTDEKHVYHDVKV